VLGLRLIMYFIFYIIYKYGVFNKYKINNIDMKDANFSKIIQNMIWCNLIINIPFTLAGARRTRNTNTEDIPCIIVSFFQIYTCIIISDFLHYCTHRMMHYRRLYKYHKHHHEYIEPFAFVDNYGSVIDYIISGVFPAVAGVTFISLITGNHIHFINIFMFNVIITAHSISQHSNLNLPYSPLRMIPFTNADEFHVKHHNLFNSNYAEFFPFWDNVFGTIHKPKAD
jgi:sterol desaturase/sphingolipid hydroxylase (fatty acid hydroxylase superfamily)